MSNKPTFDEIILRLLDFWKEQGCLIWQPYNVQVGAGTMNPATVLRVLGPEPWNIAYVEPSIRPDDGRFGENPNRMQQFYQLQVILQPDPGNPQELYLDSLKAIGIDLNQHDIRFVEDNWENPALGAAGLGWEVWLDGQEITQFTYFQQAGALTLDPVAVELTYGLDRIALVLQDKDAVWEMEYGAGISYANVLLQAEKEHCEYYFNVADVPALRAVYDTYEREAERCIEAGLVIPAHDYNLKCSHIFNVLDTRGAVGVTERADKFRRMRNIALRVSKLYLAQREALGYPLLGTNSVVAHASEPSAADYGAAPDAPQTLVLEIGSEEIPAADLNDALAQLNEGVPAMLADARLDYDRYEVLGTPRRLAVIVHGLAPRQPDLSEEVKGPPAERAFDEAGNPTKAAEGFARGKGVAVADLKIVTEGGKRYAAALVHTPGRSAVEVLATALPELIRGLKFQRSMRWNDTNIAYSRPLRWILALYGPEIVPFNYAGVNSDRRSRGLRLNDSPLLDLDSAAAYAQTMADNGIMLDPAAREAAIMSGARALAAEVDGVIPDNPGLLNEVAGLNEYPTPLRGRFAERYLALPAPVLVAVMRKHQRYFPVYAADRPDGGLLPYFIAVRNGDERHLDVVTAGNEHVIRARFADAEFFYKNDTGRSLADFRDGLKTLTFQGDLGSMLDKSNRLEELAPQLGQMFGLDAAALATAKRAAHLAKADLATEMVVEMTSLQGIMGAHYARLSGETDAVAAAIAVQYDAVTPAGAPLALHLADRLDSLVGLAAVGLMPKGSNDPFALRRAAIQVIENLVANQVDFDLRPALGAAAALLPVPVAADTEAALLAFIAGRLDSHLRDQGFSATVVKAVLAELAHNPYRAGQVAAELEAATGRDDWPALLDAFARCVRITRKETAAHNLRPAALAEPAEQALHAAYQTAAAAQDGRLATFVASLVDLEPAISRFFDDVLVMDEDEGVRTNRLALLQHIAALSAGLADLSQLEGF